MKSSKPFLRLSLAVLCGLSVACSGSSTGTSSSSSTGGSSSGGSTSSDSAGTASTTSTSQAVVTGSAGTSISAAQSSATGVSTLVRAQYATRNLAAGGPSRIEGSYDFGPETFDCDEDGSITMSGSETYSLADDFTSFSMDGDFSMEFDNCTEDVVVEAEDGTCLLTGSMDGGFDMDFTYESDDLSSYDYSMTMDMVTQDGGLDMSVYDLNGGSASVNVEFDLHAESTNASTEVALTGTFTIDGVEYDASEEVDTTSYTMEELDCVEVADEDNDGEEDAEPGEEGYEFEDDDTDDSDDAAEDLITENVVGIWVADDNDTLGDPGLDTLDQIHFHCDGMGELSFNTEDTVDGEMQFSFSGDDLSITDSAIDDFTIVDVAFSGEVGVEGEYSFTGTIDGDERTFTLTDLGTDMIGDCELTAVE